MKINGVGISDYTSEKQVFFRDFLRIHLPIAKGIIKRNKDWCAGEYFYIDLTAGPGGYEQVNGGFIYGSPVIFLREVRKANLKYHALFYEVEPTNAEELGKRLESYRERGFIKVDGVRNVGFTCKDYRDVFLSFHKPAYGLFYIDPSGDVPCFDSLGRLSRSGNAKYIDMLINISATNIKRIAKSPMTTTTKRLHELLEKIDKKYWLVREPYGRHQWTFLLGTNWAHFPTYKKGKFYRIDGKDGTGKDILARLSMTRKEYEETNGQLELFGVQKNPFDKEFFTYERIYDPTTCEVCDQNTSTPYLLSDGCPVMAICETCLLKGLERYCTSCGSELPLEDTGSKVCDYCKKHSTSVVGTTIRQQVLWGD